MYLSEYTKGIYCMKELNIFPIKKKINSYPVFELFYKNTLLPSILYHGLLM